MNIMEATVCGNTKIRRSAWVIKNNYIRHMNNDHFLDENDKWYMLSREDAISSDWELYEEKSETYSFQEALLALNEGKKIARFNKVYPDRKRIFIKKKEYITISILQDSLIYECGENIFSYEDIMSTDWIIEE